MNKTLQMVFVNELGRNVTISVIDPRDDVTAQQVSAVMSDILTHNAFVSAGGRLVSAAEARVVSRGVEQILG
ncbi:MAG: hypothetical protein DDT37_01038 [Firmicutes bacterium]|nr:hypothetical protein [candidate division NPL-UPA2 bacterium]